MKFNELDLSTKLQQAIKTVGFDEATEIQARCIPLILNNEDVIGQSETGSGKTAAFVLPILDRIMNDTNKKTKVLIVSPTRELAMQISNHIRQFTTAIENVRTVTVYGGESIERQIRELKRGADIVVGTPGRLLDHVRRKTIRLAQVEHVVLDEADEMLQMGFIEDIETLLSAITSTYQMSLFSATMPSRILELSNRYLKNPTHIKSKTNRNDKQQIEQLVYEVDYGQKTNLLTQLIAMYQPKQAMIFCNTKKMVDDLAIQLQKQDIVCSALHGDMRQEMRTSIMKQFKNKQIDILIATDVAARGIDVDSMDLVINYDLPQQDEYYIHRIGRTGRAGREGKAISMISSREKRGFNAMLKRYNLTAEYKDLLTQTELNDVLAQKLSSLVINSNEISHHTRDLMETLRNDFDDETLLLSLLQIHVKANPLKEIKSKKKKQTKEYTRYSLNIGSKHGVSPKQLVKKFTTLCGVNQKAIGNIKISNSQTIVDIEAYVSKKQLENIQNISSDKRINLTVLA